jgi:hypothetical protein
MSISSAGRGICSDCGRDLGPRNIPPGTVSHGYCPPHEAEMLAKVDGYTRPQSGAGVDEASGSRPHD